MSPRTWFRIVVPTIVCLTLGATIAKGHTSVYVLAGIGARLGKDVHSGQLLIVTPIYGGPAHKAGLYAGDLITAITRTIGDDGKRLPNPEKIYTRGLPLQQAKRLLLGEPDSSITLTVQREGRDKSFDITITRGRRVEEESVLGAVRKKDDRWDYLIDNNNKIGYIRILHFARNTSRDLQSAMADRMKQGIQGLILDLRFNPGGLLTAANDVADLFIDDGLIFSVQRRGGPDRAVRFEGRREGSLLGFPMVCLINGSSASASEIVAAALQDHKRALIIGERSEGKASHQNLLDFEVVDPKTGEVKRGVLKVTTAEFKRPNGEPLNKASTPGRESDKWGVVPDKVMRLRIQERCLLAEHLRKLEWIERPDRRATSSFDDRQLAAALEYLRVRIKGK